MKNLQLFIISFILIVVSACSFSASTANIADAKMARDKDGNEPTTTFAQDEVFYAVVDLANAPDDTTVKAVWTAVEAEGTDPNLLIDETELASGSGSLNFNLTNDQLWPVGKYKVELFLNNELDRTLEFEVEGEAAVAEEPEPTSTPEPTLEPTSEPTATNTPQTSTGDTLGGGSSDETADEPTEEAAEPEPLPFQPDPYVHPSGAFSFSVPEGWELLTENETVATFGSEDSLVGVEFFNAETVFDEATMQNFINQYLDSFIVADEYEGLNQEVQPDDSIYVTVASQSSEGETIDADFFFEQHDTIVYILYFSTFAYEEMNPTWNEIIASYTIDPEAALIAAPASAPTPEPPTPTPAPPPPTATPAPAANPFAPPPGVARVYLVNRYGSEYNIDFGDGSGSIAVLPGVENFYHDVAPGSYNPGLSLPGGGATNVQFEIKADEAWIIIVTEELGVRGGKVYP